MNSESTTANSEVGQQAFSIETFGEAFGIGRSKIFEELRSGRLQAVKLGTRTLISGTEALRWFEALPRRSVHSVPRNRKPRLSQSF
jgi:hypothetical protein